MQKTKSIALILGVLTMSFLVGYLVLAWTEPSQVPPGGNVAAPLNVSNVGQIKTGNLTVNALGISASGNALLVPNGNVGIGTTDPGAYKLNVNGTVATGNLTVGGGMGKINVGTVDPIFNINGKKYATYMADYAGGARIETSGIVQLNSGNKYTIDFNNLEKGSNLWLFWQASNKDINVISVLLTSSFEGKTWYKKDGNMLIIYGDKKGEVSYRLTAPRVDYQKWGNLAEDQTLEGIDISNY